MEDSCRIQFVQQLLDSVQACLDIKTLIENQRCIQIFKSIYGSKCRQDDAIFLNIIHLDEFHFLLTFHLIFFFNAFFSVFLHKYKKMVWVWLRNLNQNVFISIFWSQDIYESSSKIKLNIKQQNQEVGQDVEINHNRKYSTIYFSYIE